MWLDRRRVPGSDKQKKTKLKTHSWVSRVFVDKLRITCYKLHAD